MGKAIFIFEPQAAALKRAVAAVEQLGFAARAAATPQQALGALEQSDLDAFLVGHSARGREIAEYIREFTGFEGPLGLLVAQDEQDPQTLVEESGADGFLRQPFTAAALESFLSASVGAARMRGRLAEAQRALAEAQSKIERGSSTAATPSGFHDFEAVKDLLIVEVRRAKRYGYPLSVLLVGLDPLAAFQKADRTALERDITGGLAVAIAKSIRVIDLPIHYADDRILVFLPHTDLGGAEHVGRRIKKRIKRITYRSGTLTAQLTASVGVAGLESGDRLTFSKLIKSAVTALRAAQLKGGDKVVKRLPNGAS